MTNGDINSSNIDPNDAQIGEATDTQIADAFRDLNRRASTVDLNRGPHQQENKSLLPSWLSGVFDGQRRPMIPALSFVVIAALAGFVGWQLVGGDGGETNVATEDVESDNDDPNDSDGNGVSADKSVDSIGTITSVGGTPEGVFVLLETEFGTEAGFPTDLNSWWALPADAVDAIGDGNGGIIWVNDSTVFRQPTGGETSTLASSARPPRIVSSRLINDKSVALVMLDDKLVGFGADGSQVELTLDQFDGTVEDVAIDGTTLAAVLRRDNDGSPNRSVETLSLTDGSIQVIYEAVEAEDAAAPRYVAMAGESVIVATLTDAIIYAPDGSGEQDRFPLPISPDQSDWWTLDAAGTAEAGRLIMAFGEAALTFDLATGDRAIVPGVVSLVRAAHWADVVSEGDEPFDGEVAVGDRYRVDTEAVAADSGDPFLNMRSGPGAAETLVAKLPPNYRGLRATGNESVTDDGATWLEFELLDPLAFTSTLDVTASVQSSPTGWVNSALTIPLTDGVAVGVDEVNGCINGEFGQIGGDRAEGLYGEAYVYGLESTYLSDSCLRVVLTVGEGQAPIFWDEVPTTVGPANSLPMIRATRSGGHSTTISLGSISSVWPTATETGDGVYIARATNDDLELVAPALVGGVDITPLPEAGVVVIDLEVEGPAPVSDRFVALTGQPLVGDGSVSVVGIARPFESQMGLSVVDASDQPVTAVFSGSTFLGTLESDAYGVGTTDWISAWGRFAVKVDGLAPGDYTMVIDAEGGVDSPRVTRVPFTITDAATSEPSIPSQDEAKAAFALVSFSDGGSIGDVPLADNVTLALGPDEQAIRTRSELADRGNWTINHPDGFAEFDGPFNALDVLSSRYFEYSSGPINHCAGPPRTWPAEWQGLSQVNIEPVGIDSCIAWFGVSLFLNADGEIEVVSLDLFGP